MAKPKQDILVQELPNRNINIYIDNPEKEVNDIKAIEGVSDAYTILGTSPIFASVDPRYDKSEVAQEIRELLLGDVPDVFREE